MGHFKIEEAVQAREELTKRLASLGTVVAENVKVTAKDVITETIDAAEFRVRASIDEIDPRAFIRQRPLTSLAGAFVTGLVLSTRRTLIQRSLSHPIFTAVTAIGVDLLRAYAMSHIKPSPVPAAVPTRSYGAT